MATSEARDFTNGRAGFLHTLPNTPPVIEGVGTVDKAWISPAGLPWSPLTQNQIWRVHLNSEPRHYDPTTFDDVWTISPRMLKHSPQVDLIETAILHPLQQMRGEF